MYALANKAGNEAIPVYDKLLVMGTGMLKWRRDRKAREASSGNYLSYFILIALFGMTYIILIQYKSEIQGTTRISSE